jgi:hypothetical protein
LATTNLTFGTGALNAAVDAVVDLVDVNGPGKLVIMESDDTVLAELVMSNPAFGASTAGVATANAITKDDSANATGTAAKFKIEDGNALSVIQGSVGIAASGEALILNTVSIVAGIDVEVSALTVTLPNT